MRLKLRLVSIALLVSFFFQQVSYAAGDLKPQEFDLFQKPLVHIKLPESVAAIEDAWNAQDLGDKRQATSDKKLIYLLQDAHTNESGQINLSKTLDILLKEEKDLKYIFVEAGQGDDSLSLLRKYTTLQDRKRVAEEYLKK